VAPPRPPTPEPPPARSPADAPAHPLAERARESACGHYVYGVVAAGTASLDGLGGVAPEHGVHLVEAQGLAAIASEVPLSEFGEDSIRENLDDVAWLEEKARGHEEVLEAVLAATTVVPLRLCTIFSSEREVREMLDRERGVLRDALARLGGKAEWGVKAFAEAEALEREATARAGADGEDEDRSSGVAYMNRKRRAARAREEAEEVADEWARRIHERFAAGAAEALLNPLQRRELSGHEGEMLLNGVYLVADEEAEAFAELAAELGEEFDRRGAEVVLTGPWPAYNFVKSSIEAAR
jgi:hypothetical protein